jgi:hypothetical protein
LSNDARERDANNDATRNKQLPSGLAVASPSQLMVAWLCRWWSGGCVAVLLKRIAPQQIQGKKKKGRTLKMRPCQHSQLGVAATAGTGGRYSTATLRSCQGPSRARNPLWLVLPFAVLLFPCASFQAVEYHAGYQEQECDRHDDENDSHTPEYVVLSWRSKCRL